MIPGRSCSVGRPTRRCESGAFTVDDAFTVTGLSVVYNNRAPLVNATAGKPLRVGSLLCPLL